MKIWNVQMLTLIDLRFKTERMRIYKQCYLKMQLEFGGVNLSSIYSRKHTQILGFKFLVVCCSDL